jgi:LmbE family N-acetylglucosaminyl deacetylase
MVVATETTNNADGAATAAERGVAEIDVAGEDGAAGHGSIEIASVREASRLAALQTELRLLGDLASLDTVQGLQPYLALNSPCVTPATIVQSERDARFRIAPTHLENVLRHFGSRLEEVQNAPSLLIVVAHQDDETIGAGAQLARLNDVTVLHVTDGAPRDPAYARRFGYANVSDYGEARREEAAAALRLAGIPEERQLCLGIPDGEAPFHLVELAMTLADVMDELRPEAILTHPYEGGHTDHDAIAFAVHLACGILRRDGTPTPVVLELTSYHQQNGQRVVHSFLPQETPVPMRSVRLSREAAELKARMYECFRTQQRCLQQFTTDIERFRAAPRYNFTRPPHDGTLDYERRSRRMSGGEWRSHARRALARLRTRKHGRISMVGCSVGDTVSSTSSDVATEFIHTVDGR